ncbi:MAG: 1-acyl-sn-glycerol-3-phosphate acyltransferase [Thermoanaerobaculia bacterium]
MKNFARTQVLRLLKLWSRLFYRFEFDWMTEVPEPPWEDLRIVTVMNHTSLYEWLFTGDLPDHFLKRIATRGHVPVADKTISRPFLGIFLRLLAPHMISITREPDHTWQTVIDRLEPDSMVIIFPEGRMKRANGLDKHGRPMSARGGIADVLKAVPSGRMLIAYSGGLHHVQAPGQILPRLFKTIRMAFEFVDIEEYRGELTKAGGDDGFRQAVRVDLDARRDRHSGRLEALTYGTAASARRQAS